MIEYSGTRPVVASATVYAQGTYKGAGMANWPAYVGMATGIFGAVMGYLGYRRSSQIKQLDLRIEVRKQISDARASLGAVRRLMDDATASRLSAFSAAGRLNSGVSADWEKMIGADKVEVDNMAASIRSEDANYTSLTAEQLESELVAAHSLNTKLGALADKYRGKLNEGEVARDRLR